MVCTDDEQGKSNAQATDTYTSLALYHICYTNSHTRRTHTNTKDEKLQEADENAGYKSRKEEKAAYI
ncbi:hypothetical protein BaRGS_00009217 [Batillaria attramentaria]|uniref:Uncharacterized protein n=1 Tax=Batillaria attramentaria TaxID=370345 RepID=A0ABD0LJ64_9CAEN